MLSESGSKGASDSRGWGVRRSSKAGRHAAQLCEICMESSTSLGFKGHSAADMCTNPQQTVMAAIFHRAAMVWAVFLVNGLKG